MPMKSFDLHLQLPPSLQRQEGQTPQLDGITLRLPRPIRGRQMAQRRVDKISRLCFLPPFRTIIPRPAPHFFA